MSEPMTNWKGVRWVDSIKMRNIAEEIGLHFAHDCNDSMCGEDADASNCEMAWIEDKLSDFLDEQAAARPQEQASQGLRTCPDCGIVFEHKGGCMYLHRQASQPPEAQDQILMPNGSFTERVREIVLASGLCGVPGHFKFQQNGSSCLMCQENERAFQRGQQAMAEKAVQRINAHHPGTDWFDGGQLIDKLVAEVRSLAGSSVLGAATTTSTQGPFDKRLHERLGAYLNTMVADLGIQGKGEYLRNLFAQFEQEMAVAPPREEVRALVAKWRKEGNASIYSHENRDLNVAGAATLVCADELEAALAATPTQPQGKHICCWERENPHRCILCCQCGKKFEPRDAATPTLRVQP